MISIERRRQTKTSSVRCHVLAHGRAFTCYWGKKRWYWYDRSANNWKSAAKIKTAIALMRITA